ncbi:MAG TPA: TerB family tellurite resistance protein [Rhizobacter sp.]|nr:TerB family tellurite resistance protein [Rhizobacter sp.]
MRSYPRNSPEAAARLVALAMIADGHVCRSELDALRHADVEAALGLRAGALGPVLQALCEDLLLSTCAHGALTACLDDALIESMVREVDDPRLAEKVLAAVTTATEADGFVSEGEQTVMKALQRCWPSARAATLC